MPEESTGDIGPSILTNKESDNLDWTSQELKEKGERIFKKASKIGSGGRVVEPEPTKADVLPLMREAVAKAAGEGDADKAGAINRNIKEIKKELGIKPKG